MLFCSVCVLYGSVNDVGLAEESIPHLFYLANSIYFFEFCVLKCLIQLFKGLSAFSCSFQYSSSCRVKTISFSVNSVFLSLK